VALPANPSRFRIGVDLVGVDRVARLVTDHEGALDELFTEREQAHWRRKRQRFQHLAGRFAAKEAVLKAFGTGLRQRMRWTDVEIVRGSRGRPEVQLHGEVAAWARRRGLADIEVSVAHSAGLAVAQAVSIWEGNAFSSD
jgi:holo-[acyl-carrier protein] synthase